MEKLNYGRYLTAAQIKKAGEAVARQYEAEMRDQYRFERAEARACGYEFPTFEEYRGKALAREIADKRHEERYNNGFEDLY